MALRMMDGAMVILRARRERWRYRIGHAAGIRRSLLLLGRLSGQHRWGPIVRRGLIRRRRRGGGRGDIRVHERRRVGCEG